MVAAMHVEYVVSTAVSQYVISLVIKCLITKIVILFVNFVQNQVAYMPRSLCDESKKR